MPELFEVVGSVLRDLAQARALSDLYSRDVSRYYESDPLLRTFPVPRAEIAEASFTLVFAINDVTVDAGRRNVRNARVSQLFEKYGASAVRAVLITLRDKTSEVKMRPSLDPQKKAVVQAFEDRFLAEDYRNLLRTRLVRFLEEHRDTLISQEGVFDMDRMMEQVDRFMITLASEPEMHNPLAMFPDETQQIRDEMMKCMRHELNSMKDEIQREWELAADYRIDVEIHPEKIREAENAICSISVKSVIRNYTWSKVDDDQGSVHSIRTLQPE